MTHGVLRALALGLALLLSLPLVALVLGASAHEVMSAATDGDVWHAVGMSFGCALASTSLGLFLGVPAGYVLAQPRLKFGRFWRAVVDLPLILPHPVVGLGLLAALGPRRLLGAALRDQFGVELASSAPGIVLAMFVVSAPFIVKSARDAFAALPHDFARTAASLGASDARIFLTVLVPLVRRPVGSGARLAWARAVSEFGSVVILAYYPKTAPVLIWDRYTARGLQAAIAPALLLCVVCAAIFFLLQPHERDGD